MTFSVLGSFWGGGGQIMNLSKEREREENYEKPDMRA